MQFLFFNSFLSQKRFLESQPNVQQECVFISSISLSLIIWCLWMIIDFETVIFLINACFFSNQLHWIWLSGSTLDGDNNLICLVEKVLVSGDLWLCVFFPVSLFSSAVNDNWERQLFLPSVQCPHRHALRGIPFFENSEIPKGPKVGRNQAKFAVWYCTVTQLLILDFKVIRAIRDFPLITWTNSSNKASSLPTVSFLSPVHLVSHQIRAENCRSEQWQLKAVKVFVAFWKDAKKTLTFEIIWRVRRCTVFVDHLG